MKINVYIVKCIEHKNTVAIVQSQGMVWKNPHCGCDIGTQKHSCGTADVDLLNEHGYVVFEE